MYDIFASEYHYSVKEFISLTLRQVVCFLRKIEKRQLDEYKKNYYRELSIQASVWKIKIPSFAEMFTSSAEITPLDRETNLKLEKAAFDSLKRMQEKHGRQRTINKN